MNYKKYSITLTGTTPLLLHRDNLEWGARVAMWTKDPGNRKESIAGDDRTPAWTWIGCCYFDSHLMTVDADNLMAMLRDAGKKYPASKGKGSLKAATQSGILINEIGWPILGSKGLCVPKSDIMPLADEIDFSVHEKTASDLGFELFVKRAKIGSSKHVRVRPRFDVWSCTGTITVLDTSLTTDVVSKLLDIGGSVVGIGDWRPGSPASGRFGMFQSKISEVK